MLAKAVFAASALAVAASAHMIMTNPVPYDVAGLNNSPLSPSGSDFPCKAIDYTVISGQNTMAIGSNATLSFVGTAVHGGGSCQLSVTYDSPPTKDSAWKVIHSIEGGCPARDTPGNLPGDSAAIPDPFTYQFSMPPIPTGPAVFAWTWFNKVGNREMYMNCAPMTITGTGGTAEYYKQLPEMFKANIGAAGDGCGTTSNTDVQFPDAGVSVEYGNGASDADFAPPASCASASSSHLPIPGGAGPTAPPVVPPPAGPTGSPIASPPPAGGPIPSPPAGGAIPSPPPAGGAIPSPPPAGGAIPSQLPSAVPSVPGGVFLPGPSPPTTLVTQVSPTAAAPAPATQAPSSPPTSPGSPPVAGSSPPSSGTPSAAGLQTGSCPIGSEGMYNCIGGTQFQRCASGQWSVAMSVAAGTTCTSGQSANFQVAAVVA